MASGRPLMPALLVLVLEPLNDSLVAFIVLTPPYSPQTLKPASGLPGVI
jgi:hypothetical protein